MTSNERFHGLDAARAIALIIGIFHHGIESFVSYANWDWVTQDSQSSLLLDILFYISHVFRMQAFFLMSGFFAHLLFSRKGFWGFILNRSKRLLLPFVLFWPPLYAATYYLWIWGIQYVKHCSYDEAITKLPEYMVMSNGFPLMHLWFLYFLILFCACVVIVRPFLIHVIDKRESIRNAVDKFISYCMKRWWGSLILGLFMVLPMLGMKDWFGVDTSASGLMPKPASFILYGMYFTLGWLIYRQATLLKNVEKFRTHNLIFSLSLIFLLIVFSLAFDNPSSSDTAVILSILNTLYSFASITSVFAFIGYMLAHFSAPSSQIRYLSDASYWGYLIHLPLIAFFQIVVAEYDLFWGLKLIIIFLPSIFILLFSYKYGVRTTAIGALLNGERKNAEREKILFRLMPKWISRT
jgi:glucan biosynthesis protein C